MTAFMCTSHLTNSDQTFKVFQLTLTIELERDVSKPSRILRSTTKWYCMLFHVSRLTWTWNLSPSNDRSYISLNTQVLYGLHTVTFQHDRLSVAHHTTYLADPEDPPRVPSQHHTGVVSAWTAEQARRRPSNIDASFSTGSFLFYKTITLSFAS